MTEIKKTRYDDYLSLTRYRAKKKNRKKRTIENLSFKRYRKKNEKRKN